MKGQLSGVFVIEKQDRFIILRKIKYAESDLIIQAMNTRGAKHSFIARGALRSKKRFGGGILEPLHFVSFTYQEKSDVTQLKILKEATLLEDFKEIRSDYDRLDLALYVLNAVAHVSQEGDEGSEFLFNLTGHTLRTLRLSKNLNCIKLQFCLKFLYQQGVMSLEPWMAPFLKINMTDTDLLLEEASVIQSVENYLDSIDSLVTQYIKTADAGFT